MEYKTYMDELTAKKDFRKKFDQEYQNLCIVEQITRGIHQEIKTHPGIKKLKRVGKLIQKLLSGFEQEDAIKWLNTSNQSLEGRTPLKEIMYNDEGIEKVINLLGAIECGIIT